jgi:beta-glucosidase
MGRHEFAEDFVWGVATSSQQIEGAVREGGRGESIWDRYANTPGNIADGSRPDVACDHYHRWRDDIERMKWLGLNAYRLSVAWPRVLPTGTGSVNAAGLNFYDALVDGLLEAGIRPFVTLYHWDLPQVLQDRGGWASRDTAGAFADYASVVADRLGDRVTDWTTHNEPWCIAALGHEAGVHAPGHRDPAEALLVAHHVLLSHGWALPVIRERSAGARAGIVLIASPSQPATESDADRDAARRFDGTFNRWYLDPLLRGTYPTDVIEDHVRLGHLESAGLPFVMDGDMEAISRPIDYLGVNYYSRAVLKAGANGHPEGVRMVPEKDLTDMGWEVYPDGLTEVLLRLNNEYGCPELFITESGCAYGDAPNGDGRVADERRIEYHRGHLIAVKRAIEAGVPVKGYFVWSLLDNFEWGEGFEKRFGLYWVDYETQERIPKDSAIWYRDTIAARAVTERGRQS